MTCGDAVHLWCHVCESQALQDGADDVCERDTPDDCPCGCHLVVVRGQRQTCLGCEEEL